MKVYIGKPRSRVLSRIHRKYMEWKYGYCYVGGNNNKWERFLEWLEDKLQGFYNITINQIIDRLPDRSVKVKVHPYDIWGVYDTLALVIAPVLREFSKELNGAPIVENEDVPAHLHMPEGWWEEKWGMNGETDPHFFERWEYVVGEMVWTFETLARDWEHDFYHDGLIEGMKQYPSNDGIAKELQLKDFSVDEKGVEQTQERIKNGLRLFGKYFECLWD